MTIELKHSPGDAVKYRDYLDYEQDAVVVSIEVLVSKETKITYFLKISDGNIGWWHDYADISKINHVVI